MSPWSLDAWAFGRVYGKADLEDSSGDVGTQRLGVSASVTRRLSADESLRLGLSVERSFYDFDDVPIARWPAYDLTTFRQRVNRMVAETVTTLTDRIEGRETEPRRLAIPGKLIARGSTRKQERSTT